MYVYAAPDQVDVLKGAVIPWCTNCSSNALEQGLGLVGAVIMPHNLYLHSGLVLSRAINRENKYEVKEGIKYNSIESTIALFVSFFINVFVICVFGASVYNYVYPRDVPAEVVDKCMLDTIGLISAGKCLFYRYGQKQWVLYVWALGLLAAGQSSTMTGTYAGQFVMEGFLNITWAKWKRVLMTRSITLVPCVIIAILARNDLDLLDSYINVEQSLLLPFSLLSLLSVTSSHHIMGEFKNAWWWSLVVWAIAALVILVNVYFIIDAMVIPGELWQHIVASLGLLCYVLIVLYFVAYPLVKKLVFWRKRGTISTHSIQNQNKTN